VATEYVVGVFLTEEQRKEVEEHAAGCEECRAMLSIMDDICPGGDQE
jgi:predicted anti-sigma-YlaC factor YlaD